MSVSDLLKTVYLGDRACKAITLDGWNRSIRIEVDCISRIRGETGNWDYYTAEDIPNGFLVFLGATNVLLDNAGLLPNDDLEIEVVGSDKGLSVVHASIGSVDDHARPHRIVLRFGCESAHIEDPRKPGVRIT